MSIKPFRTNGLTSFNMLVSVSLTVEYFATQRKPRLEGERVFFPSRVAPIRIEINIKGHYIEKPPKLNHANISVF